MKKQKRLEEILIVALTEFSHYGFKKTTTEDIANKLDITKGALYLYVKDKKDLYEKSVGFALERWQTRVSEAIEQEKDVQKQFLIMCRKGFQYLSEEEDLHRLLIKDPAIFPVLTKQDPYCEINKKSIGLIQSLLEKGIQEKKFRDINVEEVSRIFFSIYKMCIVETYIMGDEQSNKMMFETLLNIGTQGLFINLAKNTQ